MGAERALTFRGTNDVERRRPTQVARGASIQLASTRVPARAFLMDTGLIFLGGLLIVAGADLVRTVKLTGALIVISLLVFELQCWGRSMRAMERILWRHYRRPCRLRIEPLMLNVPDETGAAPSPRRPRWQTDR